MKESRRLTRPGQAGLTPTSQVSAVADRIVALAADRSGLLVAIDGCGGAGKTWFAARLAEALRGEGVSVEVIDFDDFFLPSSLRLAEEGRERPFGGDFDWRRLRDEVLIPLREGRVARFARYDWDRDALNETREAAPGRVAIVEGVYSSRLELARLYDLRVWIDCPRDIRLCRGIERDGEESRERWEQEWMPAEDRYVAEHRPREEADMVVNGTPDLLTACEGSTDGMHACLTLRSTPVS